MTGPSPGAGEPRTCYSPLDVHVVPHRACDLPIEVRARPTFGDDAELIAAIREAAELFALPDSMTFAETRGMNHDGMGWQARCYAEACGGRDRPWESSTSLDWPAVAGEAGSHAAGHTSSIS